MPRAITSGRSILHRTQSLAGLVPAGGGLGSRRPVLPAMHLLREPLALIRPMPMPMPMPNTSTSSSRRRRRRHSLTPSSSRFLSRLYHRSQIWTPTLVPLPLP